MKGVLTHMTYHGDFVSFIEKVKALNAIGGTWFYRNGVGVFIEPDLSCKIRVDIETLEVVD